MSFTEPTGWIQLYTGTKFFPADPKIEDIHIEDIAHSLSMQCRFTGHCKVFYSVAQHSIYVSENSGKEHAFYGLLHDASEAYCTDIARPLKRLKDLDGYRRIEKIVQGAICQKFGLTIEEPKEVIEADIKMLATEARDLMYPLHPDWNQPTEPYAFKIKPLNPSEAKELFLERFYQLWQK